jgi:hypothetical protein
VETATWCVNFGMKRTLIIFIVLVTLVFLFDQVSRRILGLDCIGPVLPAWGCLSEPYPTTFGAAGDMSGSLLTYGGILAAGLLAAFALRDIVFGGAAWLLNKYRPDLMKKMAGEPEPTSYRMR